MSRTEYRVQVYDSTGTSFAPGNLIADFAHPGNVGWADYLNDVPEAFFTLVNDDEQIAAIRTYKDHAHVKIYRNDDLVWAGVLGEWEANETDAIFTCYGYLSYFYRLLSSWDVEYEDAQIDTIINDLFTEVTATQTNSVAKWITSGTVQAPVTTSGGATPISLPSYKLFWKRALFLLREMAALSVGNTTNQPVFEITPAGVFNFWKNLGQDRAFMWEYGDSVVAGFDESQVPILKRNDVRVAGMNPSDVALRDRWSNATAISATGRTMEPMFFSWVRDATEMARAAAFRAGMLGRDVADLSIQFKPDSIIPAKATGAGFVLGDRVNIKINRGITVVDGLYMVRGQQVYYIKGVERVNLILDERANTVGTFAQVAS